MLMQLVIGIILILINVVLVVAVGVGGFILRRLLTAIDALPTQFAEVHARISKGDTVNADHLARIKNLEGRKT